MIGPDERREADAHAGQAEACGQDECCLLRLYVTGMTARSARAIATLTRLCEEQRPEDCRLEVIDLYEHPECARDLPILAAPMLVRESPAPVRYLVGELSDARRVRARLDFPAREAA